MQCCRNALWSQCVVIAVWTAVGRDHEVDSLSMSASNELEPGPRSCWPPRVPGRVKGLDVRMVRRESQALRQASGRGGFIGG